MEHVLIDARALGDGSTGVVRIAWSADVRGQRVAGARTAVKKAVPRAGFQVRDVVASMGNTLVRNEEVDIGLTGGELTDPAFEVLHAGGDRLVAVLPKRHALARRKRITLADLAERAACVDGSGHERAGGCR